MASNAPRALLDTTLKCAGLADLVTVTLSADDVVCPKPAPDIYLAACRAIGQPPGSTGSDPGTLRQTKWNTGAYERDGCVPGEP
ncbi:HAD family hydrolase [Stackebrandtia nassauensis]|uniref:HAD family hydrolase n=1 Tax=Stackebrandtia nassauensis TaxID=283811 RepID=UPI003CC6E556